MKRIFIVAALWTATAFAQDLSCDLSGYRAQDGLKAQMRAGALELTWQGERGQKLRAILGVSAGQPLVRELAVETNGKWPSSDTT